MRFLVFCLIAGIANTTIAHTKTLDRMEALLVVNQWFETMSHARLDELLDLYAPDATFFGTSSKRILVGRDDIRKYFEAGFKNAKEKRLSISLKKHSTVELSDSVIAIAALDNISWPEKDGTVSSLPGRISFILEKRNEKWKIVHFHRSQMPK